MKRERQEEADRRGGRRRGGGHILVDAVAYRIADTDEQGLGFGVIKRDGVPCIDEALRDRINVLSVSGSHDRLTVGSRLYRNDGKEAVLIIVKS